MNLIWSDKLHGCTYRGIVAMSHSFLIFSLFISIYVEWFVDLMFSRLQKPYFGTWMLLYLSRGGRRVLVLFTFGVSLESKFHSLKECVLLIRLLIWKCFSHLGIRWGIPNKRETSIQHSWQIWPRSPPQRWSRPRCIKTLSYVAIVLRGWKWLIYLNFSPLYLCTFYLKLK